MPDSLKIVLKNDSDSTNLFAYVTGIAIQSGKRCLLKSNAKDLYFPKNPPKILQPLEEDCAIPLGAPGNSVTVTIPQIAGGRIWISEGRITFLVNPGPALVEPSVFNPSDPNAKINFGFVEFTLDPGQLYANITYVDFVPRIPVALTLQERNGNVQTVSGMTPDGIDRMAEKLVEQARKDGKPWDKLVVRHDGRVTRILNATHGDAVGASFAGYYEPYVDKVWEKFSKGSQFKLDTQCGEGVLNARVNSKGELIIGKEAFQKPTTADILGCNSGPFTTGPSATRNTIIPRLASGFVRSTFLVTDEQPSHPDTFYTHDPTNHYARLVHQHNLDGKGYAYAYDDCMKGEDQSGKVNSGDPAVFTVTIGGKSAGVPAKAAEVAKSATAPAAAAPPPAAQSDSKSGSRTAQLLSGLKQKILK